MRLATALAAIASAGLFLAGCGSDSTSPQSSSGGSGTGGSGSGGSGSGGTTGHAKGESCDAPLVLFDKYEGTNNFTEPFSWGAGTSTPACGADAARPAVFVQWTADKDESSSFKVYVSGNESVTLEVFEGSSCSGTPRICTKDKLPIGAEHVAGAYVPITDGQPITVVVTANESSAPSGEWTISMGD